MLRPLWYRYQRFLSTVNIEKFVRERPKTSNCKQWQDADMFHSYMILKIWSRIIDNECFAALIGNSAIYIATKISSKCIKKFGVWFLVISVTVITNSSSTLWSFNSETAFFFTTVKYCHHKNKIKRARNNGNDEVRKISAQCRRATVARGTCVFIN